MELSAYFDHPPEVTPSTPMPIHIKGARRADLPAFFGDRGYTTGAEIGVYKGDYSLALCEGIPGLRLFCVDRWAPYRNKKTGRTIFRSAVPAYDEARAKLAPYDCTFLRMDSLEAAKQIPDGSLDFVYIDADHWFSAVVADLAAWVPKVRPGGVVAGHDYDIRLPLDNRVRTAVEGWTTSYAIRPWYVLGRFKVLAGEPHDPELTWMYFK